ncbi:hypothetical protein J2W56_006756 [Nocardia kruczakiae]|uniref:Uncharacterized protein n=1 Tax=Nocardia kruczakiae TaxID=261477 RepID=A0ABU1XR07_9NOCA|nr:hypothetical protein [Nocardia kruczakiae]
MDNSSTTSRTSCSTTGSDAAEPNHNHVGHGLRRFSQAVPSPGLSPHRSAVEPAVGVVLPARRRASTVRRPSATAVTLERPLVRNQLGPLYLCISAVVSLWCSAWRREDLDDYGPLVPGTRRKHMSSIPPGCRLTRSRG